MKKNIFDKLVIVGCLIVLYELIVNKMLIFDTISFSLDIWVKTLIPSLFPFFIISDILISYEVVKYIPKGIRNFFKKLFNVSDSGLAVFLLSLLSGFPSNARNARTLYDNNLISSEEASYVLLFTHYSNPLFILGTVAVFFLGNEKLGIIILLAHVASNIGLGIMFRNLNQPTVIDYSIEKKKSQNFGTVFIKAIKKAIDTLLTILGIFSCFLVIAAIIVEEVKLNSYDTVLLKSLLEITMGIKELGTLGISDLYKVVISTMVISFGGLSIHMQVISQLVDSKISYKYFLIGRIIQPVIAGFLAFILYVIFI